MVCCDMMGHQEVQPQPPATDTSPPLCCAGQSRTREGRAYLDGGTGCIVVLLHRLLAVTGLAPRGRPMVHGILD